ncbi:MAG: NAD(P)/FAD-dependent oxidoreductase [Chloroflexi bacterium]|nr:NAD(P)/FAD-dependent oxidoreductase [Chloroflexota bacterium]
MRVLPMPISDYLDEWFEADALKGALGAAGIIGMRQGPRAAGTGLHFFYQHARGLSANRVVVGGMGKLAEALASAAQKNGAEIRTSSPVARILLEDGRAVGVALADGTEIRADVVVSNADPRRTLFGLVGPQHLEPRFMRKARNIIYRGSVAKMNLALSGLPQFNGQTSEGQLNGRIRIAPSLDYLERAYDAAKYGRVSPGPYLDATIPTLLDPSLAPDSKHIMNITMQYAPYDLRDGNWNDERERLGDVIIETLSQYAPNLQSLISHRQIIAPLDWEREYGLTEGSVMHGQMGLDQLLVMRPVARWSRYETPIENLYLCGAGTHPGGGVTGAPGYNAAGEILKNL